MLYSGVRNILWIPRETQVMSCVTLAEYCAVLSCSCHAGKVKCCDKVAAHRSLGFSLLYCVFQVCFMKV